MARSLEEDLAEFVLGMQRGPGWRNYVNRCLEFWKEHYWEPLAEKDEEWEVSNDQHNRPASAGPG